MTSVFLIEKKNRMHLNQIQMHLQQFMVDYFRFNLEQGRGNSKVTGEHQGGGFLNPLHVMEQNG